jgi:hypothetical protein
MFKREMSLSGIIWSQDASRGSAYQAVLLAALATLAIFVLHPVLGVRDADGYAYIIGALSLHDGRGYRDLLGEPLNHWPPGYSLLLSLFRDPMVAAVAVNYFSFGATIGLMYYLLRQSGWTGKTAAGLTLVLGSGYLQSLATSVHADILTFAIFLVGIFGAANQLRLFPSLAWAVLIPIKLIAVVFLPSAMGADLIASRPGWRELLRHYLPGTVAGAAAVAGVLIFNRVTINSWVSPSYGETSLATLATGVAGFLRSIPREFLFTWYGSVFAPLPLVSFIICMALAVISLLSLREVRAQRWFTLYTLACLACSGLVLLVRAYTLHVRLLGYALIVAFLGFRPQKWSNAVWLSYGLASVAVSVINALTVNSLGSMDPRYGELAKQVAAEYAEHRPIASNSFHLLDLHAAIPSVPITDYAEAANYQTLLWVTLPKYDPMSTAVMPMPPPGPDWCERKRFAGGILFARCASGG